MKQDIQSYLKSVEGTVTKETLSRMKSQLNKFADTIRFQGVDELEQMDQDDITQFAVVLIEGGESEYSGYSILLEVRKLYQWKFGYINSVFRRFKLIRPPMPERERITIGDAMDLMEQAKGLIGKLNGVRNYCMVRLQFDAGLRTGELLDLKVTDFKGDYMDTLGKITKRGRERRDIPITDETRRLLNEYLLKHRVLPSNGKPEYLFTSKSGNKIGNSGYGNILKKQIGTNITGYQLRHAFATALTVGQAKQGGLEESDTFKISQLMGHHQLDTLDQYVATSAEFEKEIKDATHPLRLGLFDPDEFEEDIEDEQSDNEEGDS